jgi:uncharacterized protein (TIGR02246 family)
MQASLEQVLTEMVDAWNAGDATAYSRLFTEDATYVVYSGAVSLGREEIRRDHEPVLTRFQKGSRMRLSIKDIHYLSNDVAVVVSEGGVSKRTAIPLNKVQTLVFCKQSDGRWLCQAFQNTRKNKVMIWLMRRSVRSWVPSEEGRRSRSRKP